MKTYTKLFCALLVLSFIVSCRKDWLVHDEFFLNLFQHSISSCKRIPIGSQALEVSGAGNSYFVPVTRQDGSALLYKVNAQAPDNVEDIVPQIDSFFNLPNAFIHKMSRISGEDKYALLYNNDMNSSIRQFNSDGQVFREDSVRGYLQTHIGLLESFKFYDFAYDLRSDAFYLCGYVKQVLGSNWMCLLKMKRDGTIQWVNRFYPGSVLTQILPLDSGNFLLFGFHESSFVCLKINQNGNLIPVANGWFQPIPVDYSDLAPKAMSLDGNKIIVIGNHSNATRICSLDTSGTYLGDHYNDNSTNPVKCFAASPHSYGGIVTIGTKQTDAFGIGLCISIFNSGFQPIKENTLPAELYTSPYTIFQTADLGIFSCSWSSLDGSNYSVKMLKTDIDGSYYSN